MLELALYIFVFILTSGIMAMVDAAVLSISRSEIEEMVLQNRWGSAALRTVKQRITRSFVVIVILTNTINILGPILAGKKAIDLYGSAVIGVITAVLTFGTIVFSEIIPKSLGSHYAPLISRVSAPCILALTYALYPFVILLEWVSDLLKTGERRIGTEAQIRSLVKLGHRAGYIESDERQLIRRAFILNDLTAAQIMTPLEKMVTLCATDRVEQAARTVLRHEFSRYPVLGKNSDDIRGMAISWDILEALSEGRDRVPVRSLLRSVLTVQSGQPCDELLALFRDRRIHLAVVQEGGRTIGLVTLEDVIEQLVGEIEDERDALSRRSDAAVSGSTRSDTRKLGER